MYITGIYRYMYTTGINGYTYITGIYRYMYTTGINGKLILPLLNFIIKKRIHSIRSIVDLFLEKNLAAIKRQSNVYTL
jgi:hypothetical protein